MQVYERTETREQGGKNFKSAQHFKAVSTCPNNDPVEKLFITKATKLLLKSQK